MCVCWGEGVVSIVDIDNFENALLSETVELSFV